MPRIGLSELERMKMAKAGADSIPCQHGWRSIDTAPIEEMVLICRDREVTTAMKVPYDSIFDFDIPGLESKVPDGGLWYDRESDEVIDDPDYLMPFPQPPPKELK